MDLFNSPEIKAQVFLRKRHEDWRNHRWRKYLHTSLLSRTMNSILINSHKQFESNYDITKTTIKFPDMSSLAITSTFYKHPTILHLTDFTSTQEILKNTKIYEYQLEIDFNWPTVHHLANYSISGILFLLIITFIIFYIVKNVFNLKRNIWR